MRGNFDIIILDHFAACVTLYYIAPLARRVMSLFTVRTCHLSRCRGLIKMLSVWMYAGSTSAGCNASSMQTLLGPDALGNATAIALASAARWTTAEICRPAVSCDSPDAQCLGDCRAPPANRTNMVITDATCTR